MRERIQIRCQYTLGDVVVLTAAVRDLCRSFPGRFDISIASGSSDVWLHNPYVRPRFFPGKVIDCNRARVDRAGTTGQHYVHAYLDLLNRQLGTNAQISEINGDIHLSARERSWYSDIWSLCGREIPFWLICPGGKFDIPVKWWDHHRYQQVADAFRDKIQFVQVGHWGNHHPALEGAIDLRGQTSVRDLIHLVHHADGVLCGVTSLMHLAAAVPNRGMERAAIIIGGNREPRSWEAYPNHTYLTGGPEINCGNCWNKTHRAGPAREGVCGYLRNDLPQCMDQITSERVIDAFFDLHRQGRIRFATPRQLSFGKIAARNARQKSDFEQDNITIENAPEKAAKFLASVPPYPEGRFQGRGITICSGGLRYFSQAWVCIRMLRQTGCNLPIELWYLGREELDSRMEALLRPLNVRCIDARAHMRRAPMRNPLGWELKCYSVLHSRFREVLSLDADNVPIVDLAFLFETPEYRATGAIFWPDYGQLSRSRKIWRLCGAPYRPEPEFESGQMVINKGASWRALNLAWWYNDHSEFFYRHIHGDKDTFHLAWRRAGTPYAMPPYPIESLEGVMCQHDFQGRRIFQHRNSHKWTFFGENKRIAGFQLENDCREHLEQLRARWDGHINGARECRVRAGVRLRTDSVDQHVFESVAILNEYALPPRLEARDVILDVGAHIGSFTRACHERGSRKVRAYESHPENFEMLRRNVAGLSGVTVRHAAVLHGAARVSCAPFPRETGGQNTGGAGVRADHSGPVPAVSINEVLRSLGHVTLLKLDCEGSEWPILEHLEEWRRLGAVCGEYHLFNRRAGVSALILANLLKRHFPFVRVVPSPDDMLGKFWASHINTFFINAHAAHHSNGRQRNRLEAGI